MAIPPLFFFLGGGGKVIVICIKINHIEKGKMKAIKKYNNNLNYLDPKAKYEMDYLSITLVNPTISHFVALFITKKFFGTSHFFLALSTSTFFCSPLNTLST